MGDSPVVIDLGSSALRVGYAAGFPSESEPRVVSAGARRRSGCWIRPDHFSAPPPAAPQVTPAAVRVLPPGSVPPGGVEPAALDAAAAGELVYPLRRGVVESWEGLESLLHYALYTQLGWVAGEEGPVLVAEPVLTSRAERERLAQLMFETFNVAGYFASDQAVLSLYAVGKASGVAVDVGTDKIGAWRGVRAAASSPGLQRGDLGRLPSLSRAQTLLLLSKGIGSDLQTAA